jgi:tartrate-resistant acid phosphatase type 5
MRQMLFLALMLTSTEIFAARVSNVLVFGDSGMGDKNQYAVAAGMRAACERDGCGLGLMLGDNFYDGGVTSTYDPQFISKFEKPYSPLNIVFHPVLGNHDYAEEILGRELIYKKLGYGNTDAQIEYTQKSRLWHMPSKYYTFTHADAQFFALDTTRFDAKQLRWLETELARSTALWKVVYGHHPLRSDGVHGDTTLLVEFALPLFCKYGVHFYLSGHDHSLQLHSEPKCPMFHVVSGAAAKSDGKSHMRQILRYLNGNEATAPRFLWADSDLGFFRIVLESSPMRARVLAYNKDGAVIHERVATLAEPAKAREESKPPHEEGKIPHEEGASH